MKLTRYLATAAVSAMFAGSAFAAQFTVDFEKAWDYANGDVNEYYNGGTAADGSSGINLGVSFVGVSGLSNDANFTYYSNAPSMLGTAYAHTFAPGDAAYMNVATGVAGALSFSYASPADALDAIKAYSGLNGTGTLLGSIDLLASGLYDVWTPVTFAFSGTALSFDLTASANLVGFDDIKAVPVPPAFMLLGSALLVVPKLRRKLQQA